MALANYRPARQDIALGNGEVASVRGLNLNDVSLLLTAHMESITELYQMFEGLDPDTVGGEAQVLAQMVIRLSVTLPGLMADIIAVAADEPDANQAVKALPFPVQVAALQAIGKMTFDAGGGLGNFLTSLRGVSEGLGIRLPLDPRQGSLPLKSSAGGAASRETVS